MLRININHNMKKSYVMIHVIKHDMDLNSNINYRRKIAPKLVYVNVCYNNTRNYDHICLIWKWPKYFTVPFDVCSGWKGKTWKLIRFVDLDYHPNVSELISTAAEQEMQKGKKDICLEENTFLSVLNWKWEHFAQREFQHRVMIIWPIRYKLYYSKVGVKDHPL